MIPLRHRIARLLVPSLVSSHAFLLAPALVRAQQDDGATFYLIVHSDTILVERQTRTATRFDGEFAQRATGSHTAFSARLSANGLITWLQIDTRAPSGDTTTQRQTLTWAGDSVHVVSSRGSITMPSAAGGLPWVNPSPTFMEQLLLRARAVGTPSTTIPIVATGMQGLAVTVTWTGVDSASIALNGTVMRFAVSPTGRIMGGDIPAQGVRIVRGREIGPLAVERQDYSAPANATYTAEDVTFVTPAGIRLAGTLTVPKNRRGRVPAVVTLTGSGQQDRDETLIGITGYKLFRQIADTLGRRGIAVLRIDDRGVGGSGGNPATETSADYADDIRATIAYLHSRAEIDSARIGLVGHSEGGMVAPMVAATDASVRALVLLAGPSRTGRRISAYQYGRQIDLAAISDAARDSLRRRLPAALDSAATVPWMRFFFAHDPSETARHVRAPVLILQGEGDIQVTPDQAPELAAAFRAGGNTHVTMRTFPQLNHLFLLDERGNTDYAALPSKQVSPQVLGAIADWLSAQFR